MMMETEIRKSFDDATLLALKTEEGAICQEMQATLEAEISRHRNLSRTCRRNSCQHFYFIYFFIYFY